MRNEPETLEALILAKGQGLRHTAEVASIGRTSIWRWTRGLASPRHAQAAALAEALGVSVKRVLDAASASRRQGASESSPRSRAAVSA
jgi:transcriptional regulator with XRE-family HTH domain